MINKINPLPTEEKKKLFGRTKISFFLVGGILHTKEHKFSSGGN